MIRIKKICLSLLAPLIFSSCITSVGKVNYNQYNMTNSIMKNSKNLNMRVQSTKRSFFWTSCEDLVQSVLDDLNEQTKEFGGNYIENIRFTTIDNPSTTTPVCETDWGWAIAYVAPVFGPWVKSASASGDLVYVDSLNTNLSTLKKKSSETEPIVKVFDECSKVVVGNSEKIVCGDSKDRVLQKWGTPSSVSPSSKQWCYKKCLIEFNEGKLSNYGGNCALDKIMNDSFNPKENRIIIQDNVKKICY
ncbi:hypothetical protein [Silvanigrella aquatica]|uniref:Lipoprotein n=1 Tax=Silvanigrella aquatica TaxID=1915309 RepID=A0A1L4D0E3_9BACT|nr:hypothetical protein [Silvanigrella aquatica]APJ03682.1 hypothetical protein AXG55_07095 [Silvanigrella aquatica]